MQGNNQVPSSPALSPTQSFIPGQSKQTTVASQPTKPDDSGESLVSPAKQSDQTPDSLLTAKSSADFLDLVRELNANGITILDTLPQIKTVRVGVPLSFLEQTLSDSETLVNQNTIISIPNAQTNFDQLPQQTGIRPFEKGFLEAIGVDPDSNQDWGRDVKIAIIDTGIEVDHLTFTEGQVVAFSIGSDDVVNSPNSHGTGVASIIAGSHPEVPGVAPGVEILSIPIINEQGVSTSFHLSEAIVLAVDAGAELINVSLGGQHNPILEQAVNYAIDRGTLIVAAAGNESASNLSFPAGYQGVVSVGSIDALGQHVQFSNRSESLDFVAPGVGLPAATGEDQAFLFTGTSSSTPVVTGSIAAVMTEFGPQPLTPLQALQELTSYANEAGLPGQDPQFGQGIIDVGRTLRSQGEPVSDIALASLIPTTDIDQQNSSLQLVVENRGTRQSLTTQLQIEINGEHTPAVTVQSMAPNTTSVVEVDLPSTSEELSIRAVVQPSDDDINHQNNGLGVRLNQVEQ